MKRCFSILVLGLFLSGCAMPMPLRMASWAIDGASYLTTKKSVVDHGLSALNGQDCSTLRLVTEGKACRTDGLPGVAFNDNLAPLIDHGMPAAPSACDVAKISGDTDSGQGLDTQQLARCAQRLISQFGKDEAISQCDRRITHLVDARHTDDAAIWIGIQVAVQNAPERQVAATEPQPPRSRFSTKD